MMRVKTAALVVVAMAMAACGGPRVYTKADLEARKAKEATGVVTVQSRGSFKMVDESGVERHFNTGQLTQYMPVNYRSLEGDKVRVAYQKVLKSSGSLLLAVLQLEALDIPEKNLPPDSPMVGTCYDINSRWIAVIPEGAQGDENGISIGLKSDTKVVMDRTLEKDFSYDKDESQRYKEFYRDYFVGQKVSVEFVRVPILRGNAYYFRAVKLEKL